MQNPALLIVALCLTCTAHADERWDQWRGPQRDATIPPRTWPADFSNLKQVWKTELAPSYSGPIVVDGRVFTTETRNEQTEVVTAFEADTGKKLWEASWEGAMQVPFFAKANGDWIRATPACDGETLYVGGIRDVLVALNVKDGSERWRVDFTERYSSAVPTFGFVSSPMVVGEHLFVQAGGGLCKLNKKTGESVWRVLADGGGMMGSAFSSPIMATIHGKEQLLVQTRLRICGIDPETGEDLWSHEVPSFRGMNILTPLVYDNGIFTSTHRNQSFFYRINKVDDGYDCEELWRSKPQGYMSSPVRIDKYAYLPLGNGRLSCIDLTDGKETWRSASFGKYWSMILNGTQILALDASGELVLVDANPKEFQLRDRKRLTSEETWAHIAMVGDKIFVRELEALTVYEWK